MWLSVTSGVESPPPCAVMPGRRAPFEWLRRGDEKLTDGPSERERLQMSSCVRGNKQRERKLKRSRLSSRVVDAEGESESGGRKEEGGEEVCCSALRCVLRAGASCCQLLFRGQGVRTGHMLLLLLLLLCHVSHLLLLLLHLIGAQTETVGSWCWLV